MLLGILFPIGDSLKNLEINGKLSRFIDYYLPAYKKKFEKVYIFSYGEDKNYVLPDGCVLKTNKWKIHRFLYAFLIPVIYFRTLSNIKVIRVLQFSGIFPALISKIFFKTKIAITYGYDYRKVEELMGHRLKSHLYSLIQTTLLPQCDMVIFSSKTILSYFPRLDRKSVYIPNGIDTKIFQPGGKIHTGGKLKILAQSRLSPEKNLESLISAISRLDQKVSLVIIGTGPLRRKLEQDANKLQVDLKILEKISNDDMPKFYRRTDLYVHPSLTEGSPKSLIEAAACGCPILALDIPQNREILGGAAALYFKQDSDDLKSKLHKLCFDRELRTRLGKKARAKVVKRFDIGSLLLRETEMLFRLPQRQ